VTPVWAMLATALAQSEDVAPAAASGWEWWAAGGGAALLSGGGGTVLVKKALSLLALEGKVDATEAAVSALTDANRAQNEAISGLRAAISKVDDALDDIRATMAAQDVRITAANAPSESDQRLRERMVRLEERYASTTEYLDRLQRGVDAVQHILASAGRGTGGGRGR